MPAIEGLELLVVGRSRFAELRYEGGQYVDLKGKPLEGVSDWSCYACMNRYYTWDSDPAPFCPACGLIEGRKFTKQEDLQAHLRGQVWEWLDYTRRGAYLVSSQGGWELRFARDAYELERTGRFGRVAALYEGKRAR